MRSLTVLVLSVSLVALVGSGTPANAEPDQHSKPVVAIAATHTQPVHDSVIAQLTGNHGATELTERGTARGTFSCPLTVVIKLAYTSAHIAFYCGTLVGSGTTAFYVSGRTGYFHGTLVVTRGSGHYRHAPGSRLSIVGILHRGSYALSGQVSGSLHI